MQHSRSVRLISSCPSFNLIDNHISRHHYHTTPHDIPCSSFIPSRPVFPSNPGVPVHSPIPVTKEAGIFRMLSSQERMTADELFQYRFILRLSVGEDTVVAAPGYPYPGQRPAGWEQGTRCSIIHSIQSQRSLVSGLKQLAKERD